MAFWPACRRLSRNNEKFSSNHNKITEIGFHLVLPLISFLCPIGRNSLYYTIGDILFSKTVRRNGKYMKRVIGKLTYKALLIFSCGRKAREISCFTIL